MAVYLVTWNLNREKSNYARARAPLVTLLDEFESHTDPGLDSVRFLSTSWDATQISDYLREHLDSDDRLFVTMVPAGTAQRNGWLKKPTWDWIKARQ